MDDMEKRSAIAAGALRGLERAAEDLGEAARLGGGPAGGELGWALSDLGSAIDNVAGVAGEDAGRYAALRFKDVKGFLSRIDRLSIYCIEDGYENYHHIREVPDGKYDELFLVGIGMIESEFEVEGDLHPREIEGNELGDDCFFGRCIEVALSHEPKQIV